MAKTSFRVIPSGFSSTQWQKVTYIVLINPGVYSFQQVKDEHREVSKVYVSTSCRKGNIINKVLVYDITTAMIKEMVTEWK